MQLLYGNERFSEVLMTNRNDGTTPQDISGKHESVASFPTSAKTQLSKIRSISPPSTADTSWSSGSISIASAMNRNIRYKPLRGAQFSSKLGKITTAL